MWKVNIQFFFNFLILVSLLHGIRGEFGGIKEQRKIASGPQLENNFSETSGETVITTAITVDDEKFDDHERRKLFVKKFKWYENLEREESQNDSLEMVLSRKIRNPDEDEPPVYCISCYSDLSLGFDSKCVEGAPKTTEKCFDLGVCFTELHPLYIRRGCTLTDRLNKTFFCKCPLCNDKTSKDPVYYSYMRISEWEYDNERLKKPTLGVDLLCKTCETKGVSKASDNVCELGKDSEYMICGSNQACYTNIDDVSERVSRGCATLPVYNSMFLFCNTTLCNNGTFSYPKRIPRSKQDLKKLKGVRSSFDIKKSNADSIHNIFFKIILILLAMSLLHISRLNSCT